MSFENFPSANTPTPEKKPVQKKQNYGNIASIVLLVALLGTIGYIIWDKNQNKEQTQQLTTQIATSDSSKNQVQNELNDALSRLDMLKSSNVKADSLLRTKDKDIEDLKARVQKILSDKNATYAQLTEARRLINELKTNIESYTAEIEKLQGEKVQLTEEKRIVTEERDVVRKNFDSAKTVIKQKEDLIDVGSTLQASNFDMKGLKGSKEKVTYKAKQIDKLRVSFDIGQNRITQTGPKDIYICITAPDGSPVAVEALGSGKFVTRDGVEKLFTKKTQINYTQGESQHVNVEWEQNSPFQSGSYHIEIYNNGFKIGEGTRAFKKGGLFG